MNTYNLNSDNKNAELTTIEHKLTNNGYETSIIKQFNKPAPKMNRYNNKNVWANFTYFGKETKFITKLFKQTPVRISYTTNNTIKNA